MASYQCNTRSVISMQRQLPVLNMVRHQCKTWSVTSAKHDQFSYKCKTQSVQLPVQNPISSVTSAKHDLFSYQCKTWSVQLPVQNQCKTWSVTSAKHGYLPVQHKISYQCKTQSVTRAKHRYKISYQVCTTKPFIGEQTQNNTCLSLCLQRKVSHRTTAQTLQCKFLQTTWTQSVQRERLGINPFTAPASNISGRKGARTHLKTAHFPVLQCI